MVRAWNGLVIANCMASSLFGGLCVVHDADLRKRSRRESRRCSMTMAVGDTVVTTSGFYGVIIDITDDDVIVEFGNNKNCRIPMQKAGNRCRLKKPSRQNKYKMRRLQLMAGGCSTVCFATL